VYLVKEVIPVADLSADKARSSSVQDLKQPTTASRSAILTTLAKNLTSSISANLQKSYWVFAPMKSRVAMVVAICSKTLKCREIL
jgi:hypothetical protein